MSETPSLEEFRTEVRSFFDDTLPAVLADASSCSAGRAEAWRRALFDHGLGAIDYPVACGGRGLGAEHAAIYDEESNGRIPREDARFAIGVGMAMPTIRDHGSTELQERFLGPGLRGDEVWCQLYSEPGAGSDLGSLTTRAVLDGDQWIVSGQKVWTSGAEHSQFAILLARTNADAPKHRGITMFVLPMEQAGVDVRPLVQMTGESGFNEVFLDDATIPHNWVIGEVNEGWRTAVALLAHERRATGTRAVSGSSTQRSKAGRTPIPLGQLVELAEQRGVLNEPTVRQELAQIHTGEKLMSLLGERNVHPSIGKLWRTIQGRAAAELAGRLAFPASPAWPADASDEGVDGDHFAFQILNTRGMSLGGGSDEIQRNTLGERALGLPREPGPDRDTPFRELLTND
jgi:alkylation response protein AidB-like acyl-CoA dehydrogenase